MAELNGQFDAKVNNWIGRNILPVIITMGVGYVGTVTTGINSSLKEMQESIKSLEQNYAVFATQQRRIEQDVEELWQEIRDHEKRIQLLEKRR